MRIGLVVALCTVTVGGTAAGVVTASGSPSTNEACITYDAAGVMGGGTWHLCGAQARAFCATHTAEKQCELIESRGRARGAP